VERAIPLGHLAGVRIAMSWVVPLVAALYAWSLAQPRGPLRSAVPAQAESSYWLAAGIGAALFFMSLLAHEMGHALVGRHEGIKVRGITLTLLGGYTQFETEPETPGAELRVSGIGPLANFACAGVFWVCSVALNGGFGLTALMGEVFAWLAFVNLLLAVLNLLPGAPLDGAAVLGAVVWMVTRDRTKAQTITAAIGLALGAGIAVWGFLLLYDRGNGSGLWWILVGLFIATNARSRLRSAPAQGLLRQTRLGDVMLADPPLVPEWSTLSDVVARAEAWRPHTAFPVQAADGRITGLLTAELVLAVDPAGWSDVRAIDVAWPLDRVPTALADEAVLTALQRSQSADVDRILVLWPDGRVAGTSGRDAAQRALHRATANTPG